MAYNRSDDDFSGLNDIPIPDNIIDQFGGSTDPIYLEDVHDDVDTQTTIGSSTKRKATKQKAKCWDHFELVSTGKLVNEVPEFKAQYRSDAAASLVSLAQDNNRYEKLIIEEGGVGPLLKLVKEGKLEGQENAARPIGLLGRDPESVEHLIHAGTCSVFLKILKEGSMKVQAIAVWAVSELVPRRRINEGARALLCFVVLLEKGSKDVQYNSTMALMEITVVAEEDAELRRLETFCKI
ncbi:armadillo repeat only 2 [Abeliophyllum distichum]|uniref:Armadillo repeat only 2 n=1 Tax=Abeliophyllum distichum TaxID=126358 RepID=A0ABD1Q7H0_9LAMI